VEGLAERLPWEEWVADLKRAAGADRFVPNGRVVGDLEGLLG
jgi:hypothetical protein